jgi:hypothetical protein
MIWKCFVQPYYRQNAGLFGFMFFMLFLAVGRANEAGLLEYHYSLIRGMLTVPAFLITVMLAWLLYAWKCAQYVRATLGRPEFSFLQVLSRTGGVRRYWLFLGVQTLLFMPVLAYVAIMLAVGYHEHWYAHSAVVLAFNIAVCLGGAYVYRYFFSHPDLPAWTGRLIPVGRSYFSLLAGYVLSTRKLLFFVTKVYSCGVLYFTLVRPGDEDRRMGLLFYGTGLLGHGVLIHLVREMEESRLIFYRGMPVSIYRRLGQYALFCLVLLLPEVITIAFGVGALGVPTAFFLLIFSYSVVFLLNSLRLYTFDRKIDLLKVLFGLFLLLFLGVLSGMLVWLTLGFLGMAVGIFIKKY